MIKHVIRIPYGYSQIMKKQLACFTGVRLPVDLASAACVHTRE